MDQRVGVKQDHRKGEPAQITTYRKIPKISPGNYIFQRPFLRAYFQRNLYLEGLIHVLRGAYFQNFTVYANSPKYGTDLPLSHMGHQISQVKWIFELFSTLHVHVVCNLAHFSQIQTFFIQRRLLGHFCTYLV